MCEFQSGTYECRGDGYIWDADDDGFDPDDKSWACPKCNTKQYLIDAKDEAESTSFYSNMMSHGSGVTIWTSAVEIAKEWNEESANSALLEIGVVEALFDDDSNEEGIGKKVFKYPLN